jgi:hypothetical protein
MTRNRLLLLTASATLLVAASIAGRICGHICNRF